MKNSSNETVSQPAKVAGISMIKDECDIIELFVKINMRCLDHLYIVDHESTDATPEILRRLASAGHAITVTRYDGVDQNQSDVTTALMKSVALTDQYDFIIPLDADEFIHCGEKRFSDVLVAEVPPGGAAQIPWVTYVPIEMQSTPRSAPLFDGFRMRAMEVGQYYKVVVSNDLAKRAQLPTGNHCILLDGVAQGVPTLTAILQHAPLRSVEQLMSKALLGSLKNAIRPDRDPLEGFHSDQMAIFIRNANYSLTPKDVFSIACRYATDLSAPAPEFERVVESAPRIGRSDDSLDYPDLCQINPVRSFDEFSMAICAELLNYRTEEQKERAQQQTQPRTGAEYLSKIAKIFGRR
jgi:glycosyltransferase involved in cell wall biosynthesis